MLNQVQHDAVRKAPGYGEQGTFTISGEVVYSGTYTISNKNDRLSSAIMRAGGLVPEAYLEGATLTRTNKLSPAEIEAKRALMKKDTSLIFDFVADTESSLVGIDLVKINANPGSNIDLLLQTGDVIHIPKLLQTIKWHHTTATTKSFIFRVNPKIMPGSQIIVPKKPERKDDVMKWVSIGSALSSLALSIVMVVNILKP